MTQCKITNCWQVKNWVQFLTLGVRSCTVWWPQAGMISCGWPARCGGGGTHCLRWPAAWTTSSSQTPPSVSPASLPHRHWTCGLVCSVCSCLLPSVCYQNTLWRRGTQWPPQTHRTSWAWSCRCWRTSASSENRGSFGPSCRGRHSKS